MGFEKLLLLKLNDIQLMFNVFDTVTMVMVTNSLPAKISFVGMSGLVAINLSPRRREGGREGGREGKRGREGREGGEGGREGGRGEREGGRGGKEGGKTG